MRTALHTAIAASKKEPLAEMAGRIRQAFLDAGLGEPILRFTFTDVTTAKGLVVIDRVCKRHPEMDPFRTQRQTPLGVMNVLSNYLTGEPAPYLTLEAIFAGIPRSYPFRSVTLHFYALEFGERLIGLPAAGHSYPGVLITDNAWVNGRERSLAVYTVAEVEATDKKLPPSMPSSRRAEKRAKPCKSPSAFPAAVPENSSAPYRPRKLQRSKPSTRTTARAFAISSPQQQCRTPCRPPPRPSRNISAESSPVHANPHWSTHSSPWVTAATEAQAPSTSLGAPKATTPLSSISTSVPGATWSQRTFPSTAPASAPPLESPSPPTPSGNIPSATPLSGRRSSRTSPPWCANSIAPSCPPSSKPLAHLPPGTNRLYN